MIRFLEKRIEAYIEKEISRRREEIGLRFNIAVKDLEDSYAKSKITCEKSQLAYEIREKEFAALKEDTEKRIKEFTEKTSLQIAELERLRVNADTEQKRLWERLDILRDNLNTEDVWLKLWECAYSKAVDAVWSIMKKETLHMVEIAERNAYVKAKEEFDKDLSMRMDNLIKTANLTEAVPFIKISALKKKIEDNRLIAERVKNIPQIDKCAAQLEVLGGLIE